MPREKVIYNTEVFRVFARTGMSQREFAVKADVGDAHAYRILKGTCVPFLPTAFRVAKVLNATIEELWGDVV